MATLNSPLSTPNSLKCSDRLYIGYFYPILCYMFNSNYDKRDFFRAVPSGVYETLYDFIAGKISKHPDNIDRLIKLYNSGLLLPSFSAAENDTVNMVITTLTQERLIDLLPPIPKKLVNLGKKLDDLMYKYNKRFISPNQHEICYLLSQNSLASGQMRIHIIEHLLKKNILKKPKKNQLTTLNTILFTDIQPHHPSSLRGTKQSKSTSPIVIARNEAIYSESKKYSGVLRSSQ